MKYENHMLQNELLPFIFHFDVVEAECGDFGNWHENPEFLCFVNGSGSLLYNRHSYEVAAGDLAIINPDCFHAVSATDRVEYFCLIVDADFFRENGIPIDAISYRHCIRSADVAADFKKIAALYSEKPPYYCAKIRAAVLKLMIALTERYAAEQTKQEEFPESIKKALLFIRENYAQDITIDDIVKHVGFSRAYFSREFKRNTDVSMITYLNYIRCSQAKALLCNKNVTVSEAAALCGFKNLSYFSKIYQRLMGALPSDDGRRFHDRMKRLENNIDVGTYMPKERFTLKKGGQGCPCGALQDK